MMSTKKTPTRQRIIDAATKLYYAEGIGRVSVDAVAAKAGVTKRTLYYHFTSKDELIAAYLEERDQPNLRQFAQWFNTAAGGPDEKVQAIFDNLARVARHPKWRGCGFLRTAAELAAMPGHPALKIGARHKRGFETWLSEALSASGIGGSEELSREVALLMDGAFAITLVHRNPDYFTAAGRAASRLVAAAKTNERGSLPDRPAH
jgi:AcrR family transcriptional regulator